MTDLRHTIGWRLTQHARSAAERRGFSIREALLAAADPEVTYTCYRYGEGREIRQRKDVAVVVHAPTCTIVTVLWRRAAVWTDEQVRLTRGA